MNSEILAVLEFFERDKGIKKEVLLEAINGAVLSAARKAVGPAREMRVEIDPKSGEIKWKYRDRNFPYFSSAAVTAGKTIRRRSGYWGSWRITSGYTAWVNSTAVFSAFSRPPGPTGTMIRTRAVSLRP